MRQTKIIQLTVIEQTQLSHKSCLLHVLLTYTSQCNVSNKCQLNFCEKSLWANFDAPALTAH